MFEAKGPRTPQEKARFAPGVADTRPWVGLSPYTPQNEAGIRIEPPPSAPSVMGRIPLDTACAEPPEEPPE